jgi:phage terminase Nu1 subunit (DNA packaging protein)
MPEESSGKRRDVMLNARQCAESIGISYNAFAKWKVPCVKEGRENLYSLQDVLTVYRDRVERELRPEIERQVRAEESETQLGELNPFLVKLQLDEERRRLTAAQADAQEEKNRMLRHEIAEFTFISFALAKLGNSLAAWLDSIPTLLIRQAGLSPRDAERVRASGAQLGNQIAELCDEQWVADTYDEYLAESDK